MTSLLIPCWAPGSRFTSAATQGPGPLSSRLTTATLPPLPWISSWSPEISHSQVSIIQAQPVFLKVLYKNRLH